MNVPIKNYFLLTKPRVLTLLIFSSFGGAFLAKQGIPNLTESIGLFIGGYCASGAAATLNSRVIVTKRTPIRTKVFK